MEAGCYGNLLRNYKSILLKIAVKDADFIQRLFLYRNVRKLATIVERKGNLKGRPKILSSGIATGGYGFNVGMCFEFDDGSEFTVRCKVIYKPSIHEKAVTLYPITFHHVKLPDGTQMLNPSEERMIEVFAAAR